MPIRQKQKVEAELISDLDDLITRPKAFKWKGKVHIIQPMELGVFLNVMDRMSKFPVLLKDANDGKVTFDECVEQIHGIIGAVCDTITKADVKEMTMAQVNALILLIQKCVMGETQAQKKSPTDTQTTNPSA